MTGAALGAVTAWAAGAALVVLLGAFAVGAARGLHRVVDVAWGLAFAAVSGVVFAVSAGAGDPGRRWLLWALPTVWGVRLAAHIAWRSRGHGEDPRYERMLGRVPARRRTRYALRKVYLLQAALVWFVSAPIQVGAVAEGAGPGVLAWVGVGVWALGVVFEAVGDWQLARFKADPAHRGMIMDRGLWSWTRHPNYFGDFCVWWGIWLVAADAGWEPALISVAAPLLMTFLLTAGSGKALLERHMADRPGWAEYRARTSGFFPRPPRRGPVGDAVR
ncbi:DUF1295 domain-containing protein [Streptomyces sp. BI20]|uniref:DUF1295 domain-containing protein n=1 Tax=Streptomyces sp. BI20 TaxID=3403460 RepID=UPI003C706E6C